MKKKPHTALFMIVLCAFAALILSSLTDFLGPIQKAKKQAFTRRQILDSASIDSEGTTQEILKRFETNLTPLLVDKSGTIMTFKEANINEAQYFKRYEKIGFYKAEYKLFYKINGKDNSMIGFIIPIDGFGLWGPIHGYLAFEKDAITIKGLTFYDHMETPGLGAEIATKKWQKQFVNKSIHSSSEPVTIDSPPFSIWVVKNAEKMEQTLEQKNSSVDAITGASVTSIGVQKAFEVCLKAYRPLILKLHEQHGKS